MTAEQLIFAAAASVTRCSALCENLWRALPLNAAPVLDPYKCREFNEAASQLACAANALQRLAAGVPPPKIGDQKSEDRDQRSEVRPRTSDLGPPPSVP